MSEIKHTYRNSDGVRRTLIADDDKPGLVAVNTEMVLDEILAGIERDRERIIPRSTNKKVATLPVTVVEDLMLRGIWDNEVAFKKWLNSPEADPWRVWKGAV